MPIHVQTEQKQSKARLFNKIRIVRFQPIRNQNTQFGKLGTIETAAIISLNALKDLNLATSSL